MLLQSPAQRYLLGVSFGGLVWSLALWSGRSCPLPAAVLLGQRVLESVASSCHFARDLLLLSDVFECTFKRHFVWLLSFFLLASVGFWFLHAHSSCERSTGRSRVPAAVSCRISASYSLASIGGFSSFGSSVVWSVFWLWVATWT